MKIGTLMIVRWWSIPTIGIPLSGKDRLGGAVRRTSKNEIKVVIVIGQGPDGEWMQVPAQY